MERHLAFLYSSPETCCPEETEKENLHRWDVTIMRQRRLVCPWGCKDLDSFFSSVTYHLCELGHLNLSL